MSSLKCPPEAVLRSAIRFVSSYHVKTPFIRPNRGQSLLSRPKPAVAQKLCSGGAGAASQSKRWYRAAQCTELGKPLTVATLPSVEELGPGEVRMAIHSTGVNFADILVVMGQYQEKPPLPFSPGTECAGVVMEVGEGVETVAKGDRVVGLSPTLGCMAEEVVISEGMLWKMPSSISFSEAAAIPCNYGTAWVALTRKANLQPGESLLVTAAAGGVGLAAVDIGSRALGAKVIGAAGGPEKCELVRSRGAVDCIDYRSESIKDRAKELTDGEGVNVILDVVGGDVWNQSIRSIAWEGRAVVIGFASGEIPKIPANILLLKSISATGMYWGRYAMMNPPVFKQSVNACFDLYTQGKIAPHVCKTFPLDKVNEAFMYMKNRQSTGKVVIAVR